MEQYIPPYSITDTMLMQVAQIAEKAGKLTAYQAYETKPYLRRNNHIRSVYSSLAIEANSLSLDEVRSVINGQSVIGPEKEIQEVKNAHQAYSMLGSFDPYSVEDLKKLHNIMTQRIIETSGKFRNHNEGVFNGDKCIFVAPPPQFVPSLMDSLFHWLDHSRTTVHPLISSSIFHYEFVFIHPFSDGNGRMARLWQTALLIEWNPIFRYLPLESEIHSFQDAYYDAISASHISGNSNAFIEFMLEKINLTLDKALRQISKKDAYLSNSVQKLLDIMEYETPYTALQLMERLNLKSRDNFRKFYLNPAIEKGLVVMSIPDKPTSRNQTYIKV